MGGTLGAQILLVLIAPILTRLYNPEDFGTLATFVAILSILSVVSSLRYELVIPLPSDSSDAGKILLLSLLILIIFSILMAFISAIWGEEVLRLINTPGLIEYLWVFPFAILISGVYRVLNYWAVRLRNFRTIAKTKIKQSIITIVLQLSTFKLGGLGLIAGQTLGQGAGISELGKSTLSCFKKENFSLKKIKRLAVEYKQFPTYSTLSGLVNIGGQQAMPLLLASIYGLTVAGLYALTSRVLTAPLIMLGRSIGQVFLGHGATAHRDDDLGEFVSTTFEKLLFLAIPVVLFVILFSPDLFGLTFGREWREAGAIAQLLALNIFGQFLCSPLSQVLAITGKQKLSMFLNTLLFLSRVLVVLLISIDGSYMEAILGYSIVSLCGYLVFLFYIFKEAHAKFSMLKSFLLDFLLISLLIWISIFESRIDIGIFQLACMFSIYMIFHFSKNKKIIKKIWNA